MSYVIFCISNIDLGNIRPIRLICTNCGSYLSHIVTIRLYGSLLIH